MTVKKRTEVHGSLAQMTGPISLLLLWWWGSSKGLWSPFIIPSPEDTARTLLNSLMDGSLLKHVAFSMRRVFSGFMIASMSAIPAGILSGISRAFQRNFSSTVGFLNHVPPLALFPLLMLWFGIGEASKTGIILLASFFPIYLNTMEGVRAVDPSLIDAARSCGASPWRTFAHVILPCAIPGIVTGMRLGLSYGWRSLVGAELVASSSGLGFLLNKAEVFARPDLMMATLITMGILGLFLDQITYLLTMNRKRRR